MRSSAVALLVVCLAVLASAGCSVVLKESLREAVESCVGESDGTPCTSADVCLGEVCVFSSCGDGYVDASIGETCDDGNLIAGDGCEPGRCRFSCSRDAHCATSDPCFESSGCELETHTCRQPIASSGATCTREDASAGVCRTGLCASTSCGNGVVDAGEECDSDAPGCRPDCQWVCDETATCTTGDVCEMPVACDMASHVCVDLDSPECDDGDACTAESCDSLVGCTSTFIDFDGDGYSPVDECAEGSPHLGGDCDDADVDIHPGAPEMDNEKDDNCNDLVDDNVGLNCLRDADLDGYGNPNEFKYVSACTDGWVASRPRNDCNDANAAVNPGNTTASATPYCITGNLAGSEANGYSCTDGSTPSWDWNCDGNEKPEVPTVLASCSGLSACGGTYWADSVPACGTRGTLRNCTSSCVLVLCSCNNTDSPNVLARCL